MHIDDRKRYDKRNIESNLRGGRVALKEHEAYLAKLPDVSEKAYNPDHEVLEGGESGGIPGNPPPGLRQKGDKRKGKG